MTCQVSFESFGFIKFENKQAGSGDFSIDEQLRLNKATFYQHEKNKTRLVTLKNGRVFIRQPLSDGRVLFFGTISNNEEFKVLKKQLNI